MSESADTTPPERLEFQLERAQRAAYYSANYLRDHPGRMEALEDYRAKAAQVEAIVAQLRDDNCGKEPR